MSCLTSTHLTQNITVLILSEVSFYISKMCCKTTLQKKTKKKQLLSRETGRFWTLLPARLMIRFRQLDSCSWPLFKTFVRYRLMFYSHEFCGWKLCLNITSMHKHAVLSAVCSCLKLYSSRSDIISTASDMFCSELLSL